MGIDPVVFWSRVGPEGPNGCREWLLSRYRNGYGQTSAKKKKLLTHRVAWTLARGPIPAGMNVLHRCDNPPCCNPAHLFLGSQADNIQDMILKGRLGRRGNIGEANGSAKLTEDQVRQIRARYAAGGESQQKIADDLGVTQMLVSKVIRRTIWQAVA